MADTTTKQLSPLTRFFRLLKVDKKQIGHLYLYAIVGGIVALSLPLGIQAIINLIQAGTITTSLSVLVFLVILGMALAGTLQVLQLVVSEMLQRKIFTRAAFEFAYRIPRLKGDTQHSHYVPELINRFFDTLSVQKGLSKILLDFSAAGLQAIFGLILLSFYHPFFIVFSLVLLALIFLIFRLTGPYGLESSINESKYKYAVVHWLEEMARTLETFKMAGSTPLPLQRTDTLVDGYLTYREQHFSVLKQQYIYLIGFKVLVAAGLLILGGRLVLEQEMNVGQFVAAEIIIIMILNSVEKLIMSMEVIYDVLTSLDKLGGVTDLPLENASGSSLEEEQTTTGLSLQLKNVEQFDAYTNHVRLKKVNLQVRAGERICIIGPPDSGKRTLMRILAGLQNPDSGTVSVNNLPINSICLESLRSVTGVNLEDQGVFAGSLLENVSLGKPQISLKEIQEAAAATGLSKIVEDLPNGYQTQLLPEDRSLPESALQRILLTRSLAVRPRLLLLESPLDILKLDERNHFIDYLLRSDHPWTLIVSTSYTSLAQRFDRVFKLDHGHLQEVADPTQLQQPVELAGAVIN